jgi:hypothetical protein
MGVGAHKTTGKRKSILTIFDRTLKGNSYDITDIDENVTVYHTVEVVSEIPGAPASLFRGGASIDPFTGKPKFAFITKQFTVYDVPETLVGFGTMGRPITSAKTTALHEIVRGGQTQLLIGVSGELSEGGISFIDETQDLTTGRELNYASPEIPCPYDIPSFSSCGVTVDPIVCDITFSGVKSMLHVPKFTNSSKTNSDPIFIAINNLTNSTTKAPALFWTGQIQAESDIFCVNLDTLEGPIQEFDIIEMKYHQNSNQVFLFLKSHNGIEFKVIGVRDDGGTYTANLLSPTLATLMNPLTFDAVGDYVYAGGTNRTHGIIVKFGIDNNGNILNESRVYSDNTYSEVQKLYSYTSCVERKPACVTGCNQILRKGDCTLLNISIEDSGCDISKYSPGTKFTVKTAIGKYFEKLEIFTKKTGISSEINATEVG